MPGDSHVSRDIDHSSLLFVGKGDKGVDNSGVGGLPQWFFFSKMDRKYSGSSIPRFTKAQIEQHVEKFGDFKLSENITLKDIMAKTKSLSYLPLEEANHDVWTYGRIVCLGDAIHKMTPNVSSPSTFLDITDLLSLDKAETKQSKVQLFSRIAFLIFLARLPRTDPTSRISKKL